jgi:molybdenum cofactor cytidylyltransferase
LSAQGPKGISCLLLAAGESKRMGSANKLLLPIDNKSFVRRSSEELLKYPFQEIVAVTGHEADLVKREIPSLRAIHNENHKNGMHSSIRAGLLSLETQPEGFMICLSDQPRLSISVVQDLVKKFLQGTGPRIVFPVFESQKGHPVVISHHFIDEILAEPDGDYGCSYLFKRHPESLQLLTVIDSGVLIDVDTPEDYKEHSGGGPQ